MKPLFSDVRQRAAQVTVATADEGTAHFAIVLDGNYVRPATDLEVALAKDVRNLLDHMVADGRARDDASSSEAIDAYP